MDLIPEDVRNAFYAGQRSARVPLCVNDSVEVVGTEHAGCGAAVISMESTGDDPLYLIEFGSGGDAILPLSALRLVAESKS